MSVVLGIERTLGTKTTADVRRDHAYLVIREFQHVHENALDPVW